MAPLSFVKRRIIPWPQRERKPEERPAMLSARLAKMLLGAGVIWAVGAAASSGQRVSKTSPSPCLPVAYQSAPKLGAQRLCMNRGVRTHGTAPGTYLFLTPGGIDRRDG